MEDTQHVSKIMGIKPILFHFGDVNVSTYSVFVLLALFVAFIVYYVEAKKANERNEFSFLIAVGAFVGSAIGSKLLELLINIDQIESGNSLLVFLYSGRTVIGGLIGGTFGVWMVKRLMNINGKRGNLFAPAIAIGIAIGRLGCYFNGCCYGQSSSLPWAVNFGDDVARHPTMLYESIIMLIMFFIIQFGFDKKRVAPGFLFKFLMVVYFIFRFLVEFIRVEKVAIFGFTYFQFISVLVLLYLLLGEKRLFLNQIRNYGKFTSIRSE